MADDNRIPRDKTNDYSDEWAANRRAFIKEKTGADLKHTGQYSIDPKILPGNVENFIGVLRMPVGLAGPLLSMANPQKVSFTSRSRLQKEL